MFGTKKVARTFHAALMTRSNELVEEARKAGDDLKRAQGRYTRAYTLRDLAAIINTIFNLEVPGDD